MRVSLTIILLFAFLGMVFVPFAISVASIGSQLVVQTPSISDYRVESLNSGDRFIQLGSGIESVGMARKWVRMAKVIPQLLLNGGGEGDKLVLGGTYTLQKGDVLKGDLLVLGGVATIEEGALVQGNIMLMGGNLRSDGEVGGDIVMIGGLVDLGETALVRGSVVTLGGRLQRAEGARIEGSVNPSTLGPFPWVFPSWGAAPTIQVGDHVIWKVLWLFLRSFLWAAVAVLVVLFLPQYIHRTSQAVVKQPLISGALGLTTLVIGGLVLVLFAITLICIPLSLMGLLLLILAWGFGIIAIGTEVGNRMAQWFKQEWALPVSAAIGTFLLTLVANSIGALVPCVGWSVPTLIGMLGLGAVLITRFGSQTYPPEADSSIRPSFENLDSKPDLIEPPEEKT